MSSSRNSSSRKRVDAPYGVAVDWEELIFDVIDKSELKKILKEFYNVETLDALGQEEKEELADRLIIYLQQNAKLGFYGYWLGKGYSAGKVNDFIDAKDLKFPTESYSDAVAKDHDILYQIGSLVGKDQIEKKLFIVYADLMAGELWSDQLQDQSKKFQKGDNPIEYLKSLPSKQFKEKGLKGAFYKFVGTYFFLIRMFGHHFPSEDTDFFTKFAITTQGKFAKFLVGLDENLPTQEFLDKISEDRKRKFLDAVKKYDFLLSKQSPEFQEKFYENLKIWIKGHAEYLGVDKSDSETYANQFIEKYKIGSGSFWKGEVIKPDLSNVALLIALDII